MAAKKLSPINILVEDIMITEVYRIHPEMKLIKVVEIFVRHKISGAPVVDQNDKVLTVMGEGAVLKLAASDGLEATIAHCLPKLTPREEIVMLQKTDNFTKAYLAFINHNVHRIPVVDANGKLMGLLTRSIIFRIFIEAHYGKKLPK